MSVLAGIDCGTNSLRLLICRYQDGHLEELYRQMRITRLGQGIDRSGSFCPEALERTRVVLEDYAHIMATHHVSRVRMVATSAARDAHNRDHFFALTDYILNQVVPGAHAELISGDQEAALSFQGAVADLTDQPGPILVTDLGGGSTELVLGTPQGEVQASSSINVGCVRMTEKFLTNDPPTSLQIDQCRQFVREQLHQTTQSVDVHHIQTWIGVAGTITTIAALAQHLSCYDPTKTHHAHLSIETIIELAERLVHMSRQQRAQLGPIHPGRIDVIGGGALVLEQLAQFLQTQTSLTQMIISEHDILDGIVHSIA